MAERLLNDTSNVEDKVLNVSRKFLLGKKFRGKFSDRRHIDVLSAYRDAIYVDRKDVVFVDDLCNIYNALMECPSIRWPGILTDGKETVLFTTLANGLPLGEHIWEIKNVDVIRAEFFLQIDSLGVVEDSSSSLADLGLSDVVTSSAEGLRQLITVDNIQGALKYITILIITLMQVSVELIRLFIVFINVILTHFPRVVKALTPWFEILIGAVTKCIGGLYILVAMIFRGFAAQPPAYRPHLPPLSDKAWTDVSHPSVAISDSDRFSYAEKNSKIRNDFFQNR